MSAGDGSTELVSMPSVEFTATVPVIVGGEAKLSTTGVRSGMVTVRVAVVVTPSVAR